MINPPIAYQEPCIISTHDDQWTDNYHWLRDKKWPIVEDPRVLKYLNEENSYYKEIMGNLNTQEKDIFNEITKHINLKDNTIPIKKDNYYYYSRTEKDLNHPIYCRKKDSLDSEEEILLDLNEISSEYKYFQIGSVSVSPNHNMIAYTYDHKGGERFDVYIKDLNNGKLLEDRVTDVLGDVVWHENNKGVFYIKVDEEWRPNKVYYHEINNAQKDDKLIIQENNNEFLLHIYKSESRDFLFIESENLSSNEIWFIDLRKDELQPKLIESRKRDHLYYVSHRENKFYIRTNDVSRNFRLIRAPINDPKWSNWEEIIPSSKTNYMAKHYLYKDSFVVLLKEEGLKKIKVYSYNKEEPAIVDLDYEASYDLSIEYTTFEADTLRLEYASLKTPKTTYEYNFYNKEINKLKVTDVPEYNQEDYKLERVFAETQNGVKIPISLIYKKSLFSRNGLNPLYLHGYGAYGISLPISFKPEIILLLNQGFIYAIAHVRGGDDMGLDWYESAKLLKKKNTFTDFIACAEHLINSKYTNKGNIVIVGGSAGGLLVGACINERSELFRAAVAHSPFVDALNTMLDESIPLTVGDYTEVGNPKEIEYYYYIKSYSPYNNIRKQSYPAIYVTTGISDPRVGYWEPAKWVAKLREYKEDNNLLLFKISMEAGHTGASGKLGRFSEVAKEYNFIFKIFRKELDTN